VLDGGEDCGRGPSTLASLDGQAGVDETDQPGFKLVDSSPRPSQQTCVQHPEQSMTMPAPGRALGLVAAASFM